ncbi:hypothetical protein WN944_017422 [Citrus x changshan-huyou]|uniref:Uncharacterized protein n=1 Tax=Citrus x changshan-huyou TaxID=2935761 RepID=A0AAP0MDM0_9ROSI
MGGGGKDAGCCLAIDEFYTRHEMYILYAVTTRGNGLLRDFRLLARGCAPVPVERKTDLISIWLDTRLVTVEA